VSLTIDNVVVALKFDTGADATIIGQGTFKKMSPKIQLGPPDTRFVSPGGDLKCAGMFQGGTSYREKMFSFKVYVMEGTSC
jgi:hypothetical protein